MDRVALITGYVCERCGEIISSNTVNCQHCINKPALRSIDGVRAASYFENNPIRPAIHHLKYHNHRAIASILGKILADTYRRYKLSADVIVPVPLHPTRAEERGYNQSELLAKRTATFLHLPLDSTSLQRTLRTKPQVGLGVKERQKNVFNAFSCSNKALTNQKVLLIDDVWTTGSTLDACATALKESGVVSVWGLTLAKAGIHST